MNDGAAEPAIGGAVRLHGSVFQKVLAVEMGAGAIAGGGRRKDQHLAGLIHFQERRQRRMQTEIAIEIEGAAGLTRRRNGNIRAQFPVTGIAMGRRGVQPIQAAAQDDNGQAVVDGRRRERQAGRGGEAERGHGEASEQRSPIQHHFLL